MLKLILSAVLFAVTLSSALAAPMSRQALTDLLGPYGLVAQSGDLLNLKDGSEVVLLKHGSTRFKDTYAYRMAGEKNFIVKEVKDQIFLKYDEFRSINRSAALARSLDNAETRVYIIKFKTEILPAYQATLKALGVELYNYVPDHAQLGLISEDKMSEVLDLPFVDRLHPYKAVYKVDAPIYERAENTRSDEVRRYNVVALNPKKQARLVKDLSAMGVDVFAPQAGGFVIGVSADFEQLAEIAKRDDVLWVDQYSDPEVDMDMALIQGGAFDIQKEIPDGLTGKGIKGHIMEGVYAQHPELASSEFRQAPVAVWNATPDGHGMSTFGIIFADGSKNPKTKGLLPHGQGYYTNYNNTVYNTDSRLKLNTELIYKHEVMFQTASWGYNRTKQYDSRSAEMDHIIFNLDMAITQSQSNSGDQNSRPQAWAKNIISVGAVYGKNNSDPADDVWNKGGSIGPAQDGRIKPDLCAYYDAIDTLGGPSSYTTFGGTSGATPIVAGYVGLTTELWSKGLLGNKIKFPVNEIFKNKPHAMTVKALLINTARQYQFTGLNHDLTRTHQGWGFPNIMDMFSLKDKLFVVDETAALTVGKTKTYEVTVEDGAPALKATMIFREPEALVSASKQAINDLNLKVVSPSGVVYHGNNGLLTGTSSTPDGEADKINQTENVLLDKPEAGVWTVTVTANEINTDGHVSTYGILDQTYALVITGGQTAEKVSNEEL